MSVHHFSSHTVHLKVINWASVFAKRYTTGVGKTCLADEVIAYMLQTFNILIGPDEKLFSRATNPPISTPSHSYFSFNTLHLLNGVHQLPSTEYQLQSPANGAYVKDKSHKPRSNNTRLATTLYLSCRRQVSTVNADSVCVRNYQV